MRLDPDLERRIRAEAEKRGQDPDAAVARAEKARSDVDARASDVAKDGPSSPPGKPTFERLLLGALPFMTVREFRSGWLGLDAPLPDDGMTCGEFAAKYGGAGSPAPTDAEPAP